MTLKKQAQNKLRIYYQRYTQPAEDRGAAGQQQRIRDTFHDDTICLRFDQIKREWQIWCDTPNTGLYCVAGIGPSPDDTKAIWLLHQRQIRPEAFYRNFRQYQLQNDKLMKQKVDEIAAEIAYGARKCAVGKVTCSFRD